MKSNKYDFSVAHFFKAFEDGLKKIDKNPLKIDKLHIQQDSFSRLAESEDEQEQYYPNESFAVIEHIPSSDFQMYFQLVFFKRFVHLNIDNTIYFPFFYSEYNKQESDFAKQLLLILQMLSDGSLSILVTKRNSKPFAFELVYKPENGNPQIIFTFNRKLRSSWTKDPSDYYDTEVYSNNYDVGSPIIKSTGPELLIKELAKDKFNFPNRELVSPAIGPLTAKEFEKNLSKHRYSKEFHEAVNDPTGLALRSRPEFYVTCASIFTLIMGLAWGNILPYSLFDHFGVTLFMSILASTFISPYINMLIKSRKNHRSSQQTIEEVIALESAKEAEKAAAEDKLKLKNTKIEKNNSVHKALIAEAITYFVFGLITIILGVLTILTGNKQSLTMLGGLAVFTAGVIRSVLSIMSIKEDKLAEKYNKFNSYPTFLIVAGILLIPNYSVNDAIFFMLIIALLLPVLVAYYSAHKRSKKYLKDISKDS